MRRGGAETNDEDKRNDNGCGSVDRGCADQVVSFSRCLFDPRVEAEASLSLFHQRRDCVPKAIPPAKEGKGGRVDGRDRRRQRRQTTN